MPGKSKEQPVKPDSGPLDRCRGCASPFSHPNAAATRILARPPPLGYAELHCLSNFSFLRGASHPEELVARAAELGYAALAITDRNSLAGVVRAHVAAKEHSLHLLVGAEITPADAPPLVLLAPDRPAYGRLCRLITRGRLRTSKGDSAIYLQDIAELAPGLIAIVLPQAGTPSFQSSNGPQGEAHRSASIRPSPSALRHSSTNPQLLPASVSSCLRAYRDIFAADLYLAAELACDVPDALRLEQLAALSRHTGIPLVAANAVHYHVPQRRYLHDVLTCIRDKCTLAEAGRRLLPNAERHLRPLDEIARRYAGCPAAVARTVELARRCTFSLDELRYEYPHELCPPDTTPLEYLTKLTWAGARERYPDGIPARVCSLLRRELILIAELKYEHYFLTVWDLVRFARSRNILCQGRGSAANSAVCYCLGITAVDPARIDLLFERFLSHERNEPPDIDVDFEHERREEVFQYIYNKYGRARAAITAEVITYRPRSAVRDVGKALGLSLDQVDALAKALEWWSDEPVPDEAVRAAGLDPRDRTLRMVVRLVRQILGFPRHLSQHVGGFVMTETPLCEIVPLENGALPGRTFIEWNKDDIDALGILKVDCLALGMLTAINKCFGLLRGLTVRRKSPSRIPNVAAGLCPGRRTRDTRVLRARPGLSPGVLHDLCGGLLSDRRIKGSRDVQYTHCTGGSEHQDGCLSRSDRLAAPGSLGPLIPRSLLDIPPEDPQVYEMICNADTVGVFQIESRAQMSMLPRLRPRNFYDLVIEVAIVRPGPIQGGMVHPYLRRRAGLEPVAYPSERVKTVLEKTLGVPLFQEQVMRLAVVAAGFTPGEADQLRRAMAAWRRSGQIDKFQLKLIKGMLANGYSRQFAEQIYRQIRGFGEYGFPESHAASFAALVYASAWLKRYHPAAFCAAMLNSQPLGFYTPGQLIRDASAHGVPVLPVDVNSSGYDCSLENVASAPRGRRSSPSSPLKNRGAGPPCPARPPLPPRNAGLGGPALLKMGTPAVFQRVASSVRPPDQNSEPSAWGKNGPAVRLGMRLVRGLSAARLRGIEAERREGPITSLRQLARRGDVSRETLLRLAAADAFRSLGLNRRQALWHILSLDDAEPPLFAELEPNEPPIELPTMTLDETVVQDYDALGFSLNAHPIGLVRKELNVLDLSAAGDAASARRGGHGVRVVPATRLRRMRNGQPVAVAGLVTLRQRPGTARGMVFVTLEDETGMANLVVRPNIWERDRRIARIKIALIAEGHVERQGEVIHVMVRRFHDLSARLAELAHKSRDFH